MIGLKTKSQKARPFAKKRKTMQNSSKMEFMLDFSFDKLCADHCHCCDRQEGGEAPRRGLTRIEHMCEAVDYAGASQCRRGNPRSSKHRRYSIQAAAAAPAQTRPSGSAARRTVLEKRHLRRASLADCYQLIKCSRVSRKAKAFRCSLSSDQGLSRARPPFQQLSRSSLLLELQPGALLTIDRFLVH